MSEWIHEKKGIAYGLLFQKVNTVVAEIVQYSAPHTGRLRRRTSDELMFGAHSRLDAGPTDVLEALINS